MEAHKSIALKMPNMVMCGDHPSFTKTVLNAKEPQEKPWDHTKRVSCDKLSPSTSRSERASSECESSAPRTASEQALRAVPARRSPRAPDDGHRPDADTATGNRALVQAALGSFRWPPYLLAVWVAVLVLTHALHCLVAVLERTLPNIKDFCQYFKTWTETSWKADDHNPKLYPTALACITGLLYTVYFMLYVLYSVALWCIVPLCAELHEAKSSMAVVVTDYVDNVNSKSNASIKH